MCKKLVRFMNIITKTYLHLILHGGEDFEDLVKLFVVLCLLFFYLLVVRT